MNKAWWLIPAAMFLLALGTVVYLGQRDIEPESCVFDSEPETQLSEPEIASLWEKNLAALDASEAPEGMSFDGEKNAFLVASGAGYAQYLTKNPAEGYGSLGEKGYNLACSVRELGGGWRYVLYWSKPLTFEDRYLKQLRENLPAAAGGFSLTLMKKEFAPYPAELSKSAFVVLAEYTLAGETRQACIDPKTKLFIGVCQ